MKSLAGQKGQESIGTVLGTTNFIRFRLGVGKPLSGSTTTIPQWVLGPFSRDNREMVSWSIMDFRIKEMSARSEHSLSPLNPVNANSIYYYHICC